MSTCGALFGAVPINIQSVICNLEMHQFTDGVSLAAKVRAKTLLIIGEQDKMTPARAGRALAEKLRNSSVVSLAPCGHFMLTEQPNGVLDALARFL